MTATADASAARGRADFDDLEDLEDLKDSAMLAMSQIAEWVPEAYRQAYLDGAASVLGHAPLIEA